MNSASRLAALSAIRHAFGNREVGNLRSRPSAPASANAAFTSSLPARSGSPPLSSAVAPRNSFISAVSSTRAPSGIAVRNFNRFGNFGDSRFHQPFPRFSFGDFDNDFDDFFPFPRPFFFSNPFFFPRPFFGCFTWGFSFSFNFRFGAPLWWGARRPIWSAEISYPLAPPYG